MLWQVPLAITMIAAAAAILLQRHIQKTNKLHPAGFTIISNSAGAVLLIIFVAIRGFDTRWQLLPLHNLALAIVFWTLANVLLVQSLRRTQASQFAVIFNTRVLWSLTIAALFLDERLQLAAGIGTALMLGAAILAVWEKGTHFKDPKIIYPILTAACYGIALANDGLALAGGYDISSYFVLDFIGPVIALTIFSAKGRQAAIGIAKMKFINLWVALIGGLYVLSSLSFYAAFRIKGNLSILLSLNQLQTIVVVVGAIVILKERQRLTQRMVAACLSVLGAILVIMR